MNKKILIGSALAVTLAAGIFIVNKTPKASCGATTAQEIASLETNALRAAIEADGNAPPDWNFCTMPSYYTRACEACPYTVRWSGGVPGTCPIIAICGAHTKPCNGSDGITYAMMDQGGGRYYPKPQESAGDFVRQQWTDCYVNKINVWGLNYPCTNAPLPGGVQAPQMLTWAQLPDGPQKTAWGNKYGCFGQPSPTATTVPTVSPTGVVPPTCPTCAPVVTCQPTSKTPPPTATRTHTPHIGPNITKTNTPQIGPAKSHTRTNTPHIGPFQTRTRTAQPTVPRPVTRTPA